MSQFTADLQKYYSQLEKHMETFFVDLDRQMGPLVRSGKARLNQHWQLFMTDLHVAFDYIDWSEPWIQAVLAVFALQLLLLIVLRKKQWYVLLNLAVNSALVLSAKPLNAYLHDNWQLFARKNYFDSEGMFFTLTLSFMSIIVCLTCALLMFLQVVSLMIRLKRTQLQQSQRVKAKKSE